MKKVKVRANTEELKAFLYPMKLSERVSFAERCGTTIGQLLQVAHRNRKANESLAINIERETAGAVRCEDLRPDVDWSYLRGTASVFKEAAN